MVDRLANTEVNTKRVKSVEDCFGSSGQPLLKVGRVLVGEGVLTKMCRKKPKPRQFFLFNDILIYGNIILHRKKYNKQHVLPLEEVKILPLEDEGNFRNGWQIISPSKSFAVYAATPTEKSEWMAHINKCISDRIKKSGKTPSGNEAAVWVPDSNAAICMLCQKTKFTALQRRHHCRNCGVVVCGQCSNKKFLISHISAKAVRVCDRCFEQLSSGNITPGDSAVNDAPVEMIQSGGSITRTQSDKMAESGSSADEQSDDEEDANSPSPTTFYPAERKSTVTEKDSGDVDLPGAVASDHRKEGHSGNAVSEPASGTAGFGKSDDV